MLEVVLSIVAAGLIAAYLLHIYADRKHCPWYVLLLVWTTWSLGIVFFVLLPFDLSTTFNRRCLAGISEIGGGDMHVAGPDEYGVNGTLSAGVASAAEAGAGVNTSRALRATADECPPPPWGMTSGLESFWNAVYWISMLLGYFMSDFLRDVIASGAFTVSGRVRNSLRNGALFYVPFCLLGLLVIGYQLAKGKVTFSGLRIYCKAAANAFSLCIVVLMLGYGLVEVPRYLWNKGNVEGQLRYLLFKVAEHRTSLSAAEVKLGEQLAALARATRMAQAGECVGDPVAMRHMCETVGAHCEDSERASVRGHALTAEERVAAGNANAPLDGMVSVADVEAINYRLKEALTAYRRHRANFDMAMERAIKQTELSELVHELEEASWDVQRSSSSRATGGTPRGARTNLSRSATVASIHKDRRYLRVTLEPVLWKACGALSGVLSLLIIVCESTIVIRDVVNLSIISWVLFLDPAGGPLFLVAFAVPLLYNSACVYFAFFRMKLFNFYALHTGQNSDYGSLLFNGTYMCRLAPALAYNYLNLLHEPHRAEETGLSSGYVLGLGDMSVVPFLGADYYNDFAPFIIVILCGCTYLNLFSQLGALCGAKSFQFDDDWDSEHTVDGKRLVDAERARRGGAGAEAGLETAGGSGTVTPPEVVQPLAGRAPTTPAAGLPHVDKWRKPWRPGEPLEIAAAHGGARMPPYTQLGIQSGCVADGLDTEEPDLNLTDPTEQELAELNALQGLHKFSDL